MVSLRYQKGLGYLYRTLEPAPGVRIHMFLESSRGKYVGFILALGVTDLLRSLEVI